MNKLDTLTDQVVDLNKKYETCIEQIRKVRKSSEKVEKITYTLAQTHKYVSSKFCLNLCRLEKTYLRIVYQMNRPNHCRLL